MSDSVMVVEWIRKVLPPAGPLRRYAFVSLVDATGSGMFMTVSVLFFTRIVGLAAGSVAVGLSLAGLAAMIAAVPLGSLGDRFGHRRIWVLLEAIQAVVFAAYPFVRTFPEFVTLAIIASLAEVGGSPIRGAYLSRIAGPEQRVRAKAYNQAVVNAGVAIGALSAGLALGVGTRAAYVSLILIDAASFAIVAIILQTLPAAARSSVTPAVQSESADAGPSGTETVPGGPSSPQAGAARPGSVLRDPQYLAVCGLNGLLMTYAAILTVALPLWIVRHTHAPAWTVAGAFLVNTSLVVIFQVRAGRGAGTVEGAARAVRWSGVLLLAGCLVLASTKGLPELAAIIVLGIGCMIITLAEMLQSAGSWGLSYELAPEDRMGEYYGAFAMGTRIYDSLGPILVTFMILGLVQFGWALLGMLYLGLAFGLSAAAHWARRTRPAVPETVGGLRHRGQRRHRRVARGAADLESAMPRLVSQLAELVARP